MISHHSDFMGMTAMLAMAEQYDRNHRLKDYIKALPNDDSYRMMFGAMDKIAFSLYQMTFNTVDGSSR